MKPRSSNVKSPAKAPAERVVKDIRRQTRPTFRPRDKIRIVLDGLRGEDSIAELCRKEGIAQSLYWGRYTERTQIYALMTAIRDAGRVYLVAGRKTSVRVDLGGCAADA
jgi:hypothetical protein